MCDLCGLIVTFVFSQTPPVHPFLALKPASLLQCAQVLCSLVVVTRDTCVQTDKTINGVFLSFLLCTPCVLCSLSAYITLCVQPHSPFILLCVQFDLINLLTSIHFSLVC